jgi:hypothetical protein
VTVNLLLKFLHLHPPHSRYLPRLRLRHLFRLRLHPVPRLLPCFVFVFVFAFVTHIRLIVALRITWRQLSLLVVPSIAVSSEP